MEKIIKEHIEEVNETYVATFDDYIGNFLLHDMLLYINKAANKKTKLYMYQAYAKKFEKISNTLLKLREDLIQE